MENTMIKSSETTETPKETYIFFQKETTKCGQVTVKQLTIESSADIKSLEKTLEKLELRPPKASTTTTPTEVSEPEESSSKSSPSATPSPSPWPETSDDEDSDWYEEYFDYWMQPY